MRRHGNVARLDVSGQVDGDRWSVTALGPALFQCQADGIGMRGVAHQCFEDGGLQLGGAIAIEQALQTDDDGAEIATAFGGTDQQVAGGRHGLHQAVGGAVLTRRSFLLDEGLDVRRVLDLRAPCLEFGS